MSRLFRKTDDDAAQAASEHGHLPSRYELGPQLDEVVKQAAALPLEQFAEQLMTQFFATEYMVASAMKSVSSVDTICWDLLPDNSGENAHDPIPERLLFSAGRGYGGGAALAERRPGDGAEL